MPKKPEVVLKLNQKIKRDNGYFYYLWGEGEKGVISGIYRSKIEHKPKKG